MNPEIKTLIDEIKSSQEQFKKAHAESLAQKAEKGYVDSELQAKCDAINASVSAGLEKLSTRVGELERSKQLNDAFGAADKPNAIKERCAALAASLSEMAHDPEVKRQAKNGLVTPQLLAAYESAFSKVMRLGHKAARLTPEERAAMEVGSDPKGGLLLPPMIEKRVVEYVYESSDMRRLATVEQIEGESFPLELDLDEVDAGWVGEKESRPESDTADFGEQEIKLKELYANPAITQKLLDMGRSPEERLAKKIGAKFARLENTGFFSGATPKRPRGFLTYTAGTPGATAETWNRIEQIATGASGAFAASKPWIKLLDTVHALKGPYHARAVWLTSRLTLALMRKLEDGQGNLLWQTDFAKGVNGTFLGYPVEIAADMPALGANSLSLAFGDFKAGYTIVDGAGIRTLVDPYTNKPKVHFYSTKRVGGDVSNFEAIKLVKFGS